MSITINGREIEFAEGETVLTVAKRAGIEIPHLCSLEWAPSPAASCRLCMVEVEGSPRLQTSCTLEARDGMKVRTHTTRLLKHRRTIMELLVASHPQDCLTCVRGGDCELATLAADVGVREHRYSGITKGHRMDISSQAITRDPNKCVLCGRCVTMCHSVQGVGAIDFVGRGFKTNVAPAFHPGLNVSGCIFCGQCVRACPTGALSERSHVDAVVAAIADPGAVVVVQVAPAVPVTLVESVAGATPHALLERLAAALKRIGFDAVFDTGFTADLTVMEEGSELVKRVQEGGVLPMFTSCSPGWVQYVETYRPELIPNLSTCKSPQQMAGALIKLLYPRQVDLSGKHLVVVSVMPCTAKKYEAERPELSSEAGIADVDAVITTRQLNRMMRIFGIEFGSLEEEDFDRPFGAPTGSGDIFAASGGVMESALRTAYHLLTGKDLEKLDFEDVRGMSGVKEAAVTIGERTIRIAVANRLGNARQIAERVKQGNSPWDFIEIMACPGGCAGGGGQLFGYDPERVQKRITAIYSLDRSRTVRMSYKNPAITAVYKEFFGEPGSHKAHELLHTEYEPRVVQK